MSDLSGLYGDARCHSEGMCHGRTLVRAIEMLFEKIGRQSLVSLLFAFLLRPAFCEELGSAPVDIQAAIFFKLLAFDKKISSGGNITVYVVGSHDFAVAMKKAEGKAVGAATLGKVIEGADVPHEKPSVIYIGAESALAKLQSYTAANKVLSITGVPELAQKGVSLTIGVKEGKPKILLNLAASKEEGIEWNLAILKVATTIK